MTVAAWRALSACAIIPPYAVPRGPQTKQGGPAIRTKDSQPLIMGRVINTQSAGKLRNRNRRTIAELLRRLVQKAAIDDEARDMAATIVFALLDIHAGVLQSAEAWEKRGYWIKAERFLSEWAWTQEMAANFDDVLRHDAWDLLPGLLMDLVPRFNDIQIKSMTRKSDVWRGAYARLMAADPVEAPW